jgi:putative DNA methylase
MTTVLSSVGERPASPVVPFCLREAKSLIEEVFPAQKLSSEAYKEQMAVHGKTLTALGSYWKGRKPLVLNRACILGALLPVTSDLKRDLEIFEMLMGMDERSFVARARRLRPVELIQQLRFENIYEYFDVKPNNSLPPAAPVDLAALFPDSERRPTVSWRADVSETTRRTLEAQALPPVSYRERVDRAERVENCAGVDTHIWADVNAHLGTTAASIPELVEQLGIMRFGHRPRVADTFSGSGQIPFEAARLGCDVYASDLNPISCMLTWGGLHVIGAGKEQRTALKTAQRRAAAAIRAEIDELGVESRGDGWRAKVFLYCLETTCIATGWRVPLLPSLIVSKGSRVVARLRPNPSEKRYDIIIESGVSKEELAAAENGTVQDGVLVHTVGGVEYRTKISTIRGDYTAEDGSTKNRLRRWEKEEITFRPDDIFQERLYCIQWQRTTTVQGREQSVFEFCAVTPADLEREQQVANHVAANLAFWQAKGWVPDTVIEHGEKTREPIRMRGWTHWHHLFNPRQLLWAATAMKHSSAHTHFAIAQVLNVNCRLSRWHPGSGGGGLTAGVFDNQALNPLYNYGCRGASYCEGFLLQDYKSFSLGEGRSIVRNHPAAQLDVENDIYITDPPYGDAVKYEEITEFFIAWLKKNPPPDFSDWVWDSRRPLAITGEDEAFRRGMVAAYRRMTERMPANGIQVIMFTHQSTSIWSEMATIVWASGLQVTAAWYVATETDSALRNGRYVKGTILLVLRKRAGHLSTFRDDLAMELADGVEEQVKTLTGLNQQVRDLYRDENLFSDADLQMAGYAAALRVLTRYAEIDGSDMTVEALRPRVAGEATRVDRWINHAVDIANQALIPTGLSPNLWSELHGVERFYLKMLDIEGSGISAVDNYQNFAKAFKVRDFPVLMASQKANSARLKSGSEFGRSEMGSGSELADTPLRGVLYALMELENGTDPDLVLNHLASNVSDYFRRRETIIGLADFMASRLPRLRATEAAHARVLRDLIRNERIG